LQAVCQHGRLTRPPISGRPHGKSFRAIAFLRGHTHLRSCHYERFLREKLYRIQGIRHTRSTFSLRTLKLVIFADPLLVNAGG
jgi:hypothetical protein